MGGIAAAELGPIGALAGAAAGKAAAQQAANAFAEKTGLGLEELGRPSKVGVGVGQKKVNHKKKAGRPRKGRALWLLVIK
jgi:hypothetical protein